MAEVETQRTEMIAELVLFIVLLMGTSAYTRGHLMRERKYDNHDKELREKIQHMADSLLDNWLENEMKRDSLWRSN
jgi:hypothetical protein